MACRHALVNFHGQPGNILYNKPDIIRSSGLLFSGSATYFILPDAVPFRRNRQKSA